MLLHNQKKLPISWRGGGADYEWEPFGSCEVPDRFYPIMKAEGVPVGISPVPPQSKAQIALDEESERSAASEVVRLKKRIESAEAEVETVKDTAEAARASEREALEKLAAADERARVLSEQLKVAASQIADYDKLVNDSAAENQKLKAQVDGMRAKLKGK
jgi:hypothetical protein